jgi:hypothetical protein
MLRYYTSYKKNEGAEDGTLQNTALSPRFVKPRKIPETEQARFTRTFPPTEKLGEWGWYNNKEKKRNSREEDSEEEKRRKAKWW